MKSIGVVLVFKKLKIECAQFNFISVLSPVCLYILAVIAVTQYARGLRCGCVCICVKVCKSILSCVFSW